MNYKKKSHVNNELIESGFELDAPKIARKLTRHKQQIALRRNMVLQAIIHGMTSTYDLARTLHVSQSTCVRDVQWLKKQAADELKTHISERVPWQYKISTEGISEVLKFAWSIILQDKSSNKTATLALISVLQRPSGNEYEFNDNY